MTDLKTKTLPDFIALKQKFDKNLSNGQRAEIRRTSNIEDLELIPAVYHLGYRPLERGHQGLLNVIYFLPYADNLETPQSLGKQLVNSRINETRVFQVIRSESPQDLYYLRRILQQVKPTVNWLDFGKMLYFWNGEYSKKQFLEDYFTAQNSDSKDKKGEKNA